MPSPPNRRHEPLTPLTILHVTEAMGGGTESAIREFAAATHLDHHHILFRARNDSASQAGFDEFNTAVSVQAGIIGLRRAIGSRVAQLRPDVVHLHSSWAGLLGRAFARREGLPGIVYSPHCFYFERRDAGASRRWAAREIERSLSRNTDVVVAVSPHEASLARKLGNTDTYFVRNLLRGWAAPSPAPRSHGDLPTIVTVGRVSRQKDPAFYLAAVKSARRLGVDANWVWIGGGEDGDTRRLRENGIHVTGWLDRNEARDRLADASLYVHTAAWESGPISIEEARLAGVPTVIRSIPPLISLGFPAGIDTPEQMAKAIAIELQRPAAASAASPDGPHHRDVELEAQSNELRRAYVAAATLAGLRLDRAKEELARKASDA